MPAYLNVSENSFVSIIGAGPGDPELITIKGLDRLRRADVVLYDRLISPLLLDETRPLAELIDVGKAPAKQRFPQEQINGLLVEKARAGKHVARLKGGDPFIFGRGGEECQALLEAGIPYEVIPGVSSAHAVPAYAGIPLTQRGITTSFTVVAGHTREPGAGIDWDAVPRSGTLVFLMGVANLREIRDNLLARGMSAEMPVAVIEQGTTPQQRVVTGSLADILEKSLEIQPPATIVIGEVVWMRQQIAWFERNNTNEHSNFQLAAALLHL